MTIYIILLFIGLYLLMLVFWDNIWDLFLKIKRNIVNFYANRKKLRSTEYKKYIKHIELIISDNLDNFKINDIELILKFKKLDNKIRNVIVDYEISDIEKYLRKKKLQKIK